VRGVGEGPFLWFVSFWPEKEMNSRAQRAKARHQKKAKSALIRLRHLAPPPAFARCAQAFIVARTSGSQTLLFTPQAGEGKKLRIAAT